MYKGHRVATIMAALVLACSNAAGAMPPQSKTSRTRSGVRSAERQGRRMPSRMLPALKSGTRPSFRARASSWSE